MSAEASCIFCITKTSDAYSREIGYFALGYVGALSGRSLPGSCPTHEPMLVAAMADTILVALRYPPRAENKKDMEAPAPPEPGGNAP